MKNNTDELRSKDGYAVRAIHPRPEEGVAKGTEIHFISEFKFLTE
ncbi:hypothetical protein [Ventosimonas gracilis]|nr:hypothetical protein [Ventosimonas gracilis]